MQREYTRRPNWRKSEEPNCFKIKTNVLPLRKAKLCISKALRIAVYFPIFKGSVVFIVPCWSLDYLENSDKVIARRHGGDFFDALPCLHGGFVETLPNGALWSYAF